MAITSQSRAGNTTAGGRPFVPPEFWGDARRVPVDAFPDADPFPMPAGLQTALEGVIRAITPPPPAPQVPPERIAMILRRFMPHFLRPMAYGFCAGVLMLDTAPMWRKGRMKRLQDLSRQEASDLLHDLAHSRLMPVQQLALMFRGAVLSMYFDQPEVHAALDFDPEGWMRSRIDLRRRILAGKKVRKSDHIPEPAWPDADTDSIATSSRRSRS